MALIKISKFVKFLLKNLLKKVENLRVTLIMKVEVIILVSRKKERKTKKTKKIKNPKNHLKVQLRVLTHRFQ
jgi:hypothetical protein